MWEDQSKNCTAFSQEQVKNMYSTVVRKYSTVGSRAEVKFFALFYSEFPSRYAPMLQCSNVHTYVIVTKKEKQGRTKKTPWHNG